MKIAIVGCGMISDTHVQEIRKIADTEIVAVCDKELMMAEQLADRYNIPECYSHIEELLSQCHPDVVHIITPPATHFNLILTALKAGAHVLVEKPFTVNVNEAKQVIEKAKSVNRKISVNHFHNFSPPSLRLRKIIAQGLLGNIVHIEGFYGYSMKSPVAQALLRDSKNWIHRLPGRLLQNNINHLLAKITEFIPDEKPKVLASGKRLSDEAKSIGYSYIHDELRVMIVGENVSAYATFSANIEPFQHFMTVYGTKNTICIDYESRTMVYRPLSGLPLTFGKLIAPFNSSKQYFSQGLKNIIKFAKADFHYYAGMNNFLRIFYDSIKNDAKAPISYDEIIKTTQIMDEIFSQIDQ